MTTTPTLNGQIIGQAERATKALLDRLLERTGTPFHHWVALNLAAAADGTVDRDHAIARIVDSLKIDDDVVSSSIAGAVASGLLEALPGNDLGLTATGRERYGLLRAEVDGITARLYDDLPAQDLATAGRVLTTVTARANAELARA